MEIDSKTRDYKARNETFFERFMINYFSFGEDARVGTGFEKKRTKYRCCNVVTYGCIGVCNFICCCRRPESITDQISEVRTLKGFEPQKELANGLPPMPVTHNPMIIEESKDQLDPLLPSTRGSVKGDILFTTRENDPDNFHIKGKPISYVALNIPSYMGGRAVPWVQAAGKVGLWNPFGKLSKQQNQPKAMEKQLGFGKQDAGDGVLELLSFRTMFEMSIMKKGNKLIQDSGPIEFKFKPRVRLSDTKISFALGQ